MRNGRNGSFQGVHRRHSTPFRGVGAIAGVGGTAGTHSLLPSCRTPPETGYYFVGTPLFSKYRPPNGPSGETAKQAEPGLNPP